MTSNVDTQEKKRNLIAFRMFAFLICSTIIHVDQAFKTEGSTFEILNEYAYLA